MKYPDKMKCACESKFVPSAVAAVAACIGLMCWQPAVGQPAPAVVSSAPSAAAQPASAPAFKAPEPIPAGRRVFYCSHSLMWDTPAPTEEMVAAYGITGHVLVGLERIGFSTTLQHWQQPDAQNQSKKALLTGKVDDFIMSPMEFPDAGIDNFVKMGLTNNATMTFFVQNNWSAFNADGQLMHQMGRGGAGSDWNATTVERLKGLDTNYEKQCELQVDKLNKEVGHTVLYIIPTSQALTTLRIKVAQKEFAGVDTQAQLFRDTIGHPAPVLQVLNAYVHFSTIYGRSPVGLPMPSLLQKANNPKWDDAFNKALQELAWKTVLDYSQYDGVKAPAPTK